MKDGIDAQLGFSEPELPRNRQPIIDPFLSAEQEADLGHGDVVLMPDGRLAVRRRGTVIQGTVLPSERFAAPTARRRRVEQALVAEMARRGTRWLDTLVPVEGARQRGLPLPRGAPDGWYFCTARSRVHGDYLHGIVALLEETGLYHVYLWQYVCHESGEDTLLSITAFLGRLPTLTPHGVHVYTTRDGTVLCLSEQPLGGLAGLDTALARATQWLEGASHAVRGRRFPYAS
jgi:hypothetical protein